jgi:MOSC domain-containing protein YiiM
MSSPAPNATSGSVVSIHLAPDRGAATAEVDAVQAQSERGLVGDRKYIASPDGADPSIRQLTLIECEEIDTFNTTFAAGMAPGEFRRQIVTRGVRLNDLVDREFMVGDVRVRGTMLCEPCKYLAEMTSSDLLPGLVGCGGLCAQILTSGTIHPGDAILVDSP